MAAAFDQATSTILPPWSAARWMLWLGEGVSFFEQRATVWRALLIGLMKLWHVGNSVSSASTSDDGLL